ncbi:MAG TPA: restriction endonuclease subunit S [Candidatus Merdibacter merdigallinarum]|nr:restriction endonuclease subunit S [Candidatus Merdibacter merdigallinarum]
MRVELGEVATYINGYAFKPSDWSDTGVPIIRIQDLTGNSYQANRYNGTYDKKYEVLPGDVLISWSASLGVYVWDGEPAVLNQHIFKVVFNKCPVDKSFFVHQVRSILMRAASAAHGATMKHLTKPVFDALPFYLPRLEEQRRIAAVLDKVTDLIAKRQAQLDKLDELVKSRFVEMFGDTVFNPMRWPSFPLAEMADIVSGITKGRKTKEQNLTEVPYMAVSNVKDGYIDWKTVKTISATQAEINQYRLLPDDVLMTEGGDPDKLGRGAIIQSPLENCIHQNHVFRVRLNETKILPMYFAEFLQHQKAKQYFLRCAKQTTGIASINMTQLKGLPTLVPPIAVQQRFCEEVKQVTKVKATIQQDIDEFKKLKESLKQKYFGG